jgi:hypothetical protein
LLLWLIEADVFQMPQLHKHFNRCAPLKRPCKKSQSFFS